MPSYWDRAKQAYEELTAKDRDLSEETKNWVKEDFERIGKWEYRVEEVPITGAYAVAVAGLIQSKLNEMGKDRWECFFVRETEHSIMLIFKRPTISYIQRAARLDWSRFIGGSEGEP